MEPTPANAQLRRNYLDKLYEELKHLESIPPESSAANFSELF
jgi:hypothetical protein